MKGIYRHKPEATDLNATQEFDKSRRFDNTAMEDRDIAKEEALIEENGGDVAKAIVDQIFGCDM